MTTERGREKECVKNTMEWQVQECYHRWPIYLRVAQISNLPSGLPFALSLAVSIARS